MCIRDSLKAQRRGPSCGSTIAPPPASEITGTPEFRLALRDGIEGLREFVGTQGVFNLSDKDHNGVDDRSQVMVKVEAGAWKLAK